MRLDSTGPLKEELRKSAPWYNLECHKLKHPIQKYDSKWQSSKLEESHVVCQGSLKTYRKSLHNAQSAYFSALVEEICTTPGFFSVL